MIGYVTLGTNDLARAAKVYDALLAEIGGKRTLEADRFSQEKVTKLYDKALKRG